MTLVPRSYLNYRYHGSSRKQDLVLWCFFGVIYSIYTSAWDLLMDWSLLRPHARHPFLRDELAFADVWPVYYVAIVVNVILRFSWTIYLLPGSTGLLKVFVIALLEALRRVVIWNIFRLENEHLVRVVLVLMCVHLLTLSHPRTTGQRRLVPRLPRDSSALPPAQSRSVRRRGGAKPKQRWWPHGDAAPSRWAGRASSYVSLRVRRGQRRDRLRR